MKKIAYFFIDDVIWTFRDIAREKPASIFDNCFMKMLKSNHDKYGLTVQLNLFYATDVYYGNDFFNLSEMPDCYKDEFQANRDWLILAFHARQEFPDYPYVNASYKDVYDDFKLIEKEVLRFAGEGLFSDVLCTHWLPMSKAACRAVVDCGIRIDSPSSGVTLEYEGDMSVLPYGHAARLLHNRQPETKLFYREGADPRLATSVCGYNHVTQEEYDSTHAKNCSVPDKELNLRHRQLCTDGLCLNLISPDTIKERTNKLADNDAEYIGFATHEQYFYPHYFAYQPDTHEKFEAMAKTAHERGYRFITYREMK